MFSRRHGWTAIAALGCSLAFAPQAAADPATPEDPPAEDPPAQTVIDAAAPVPTAPVPSAPVPTAPVNGVSHLPSPQSLPPGTTQAAPEQQSLGYLRDLLHAVRNDDVTMKDALLLLAQRPLNTPTSAMSPHHQGEAPTPAAEPAPTANPSASASPAP